jgi:SAM-dependent methyltransferase
MYSALPNIGPPSDLPESTWHEFGDRLRSVGFDATYFSSTWPSGIRVYESLQWPALIWHARRRRDLPTYAYRIFILHDPVTNDEAAELLGQTLMEVLQDAGVLTRLGSNLVISFFDCRVFVDLLILCDDLSHKGEAVFGVGPGTFSFVGLSPRPNTRAKVLELGCGAGAAALWLSRLAHQVIATDINPRALAFVRINAAINGINNVERREGDLFETVAGEKFDLIVSQPPFVPHAPKAIHATYRFGGPRGHELALRIISELPGHLNDKGLAVVVFEQPVIAGLDGGNHGEELRLKKETHTLLLLGTAVDSDAYSIRHAAADFRRGVGQFDEAVTVMRDHLENVGVCALRPAICVLEHVPESQGWTSTLCAGNSLWDEVASGTIERLLAGQVRLHQPLDKIQRSDFRFPDGSFLIRSLKTCGGATEKVILGLPNGYLYPFLEFSVPEWQTIEALQRGEAVSTTSSAILKATQAGLLDG